MLSPRGVIAINMVVEPGCKFKNGLSRRTGKTAEAGIPSPKCRNPRYRRGPELDTQKLVRPGVPILRERSTLLRVLRPLRLRDEWARSFQSDPAGIGI